jgi:hypothetical protein
LEGTGVEVVNKRCVNKPCKFAVNSFLSTGAAGWRSKTA